jgi:hypothetical protein
VLGDGRAVVVHAVQPGAVVAVGHGVSFTAGLSWHMSNAVSADIMGPGDAGPIREGDK